MKITASPISNASTTTTTSPRKGLRTGVRAGVLPTSDHCPRLAPPVLQTSVQYPYE